MKTITQINHPKARLDGSVLERHAVKGIAIENNTVLMLHSEANGDFKFPGGGKKEGESDTDTLTREFSEECGLSNVTVRAEFGAVVENNIAKDDGIDVFRMTNYYYICHVAGEFGNQDLDEYEAEIGLKPVWVDIDDAIKANEAVLTNSGCPPWVRRETEVLVHLKLTQL